MLPYINPGQTSALGSFALLKWTTKGGLQRGVDLKEEVRQRMRRGVGG